MGVRYEDIVEIIIKQGGKRQGKVQIVLDGEGEIQIGVIAEPNGDVELLTRRARALSKAVASANWAEHPN